MGGFSAVLGNPPFLGGKKVSQFYGVEYRNFLIHCIASGVKAANADLCSFFFLNSFDRLSRNGIMGMIGTNSISQGQTRELGLEQIINFGGEIKNANIDVIWPGDAAVVTTNVTIVNGEAKTCTIGSKVVSSITSFLTEPGKTVGEPFILQNNKGIALKGCSPNGKGFILDKMEALQILSENKGLNHFIKPYLVGSDLNNSIDSSASRYIIDVNNLSFQDLKQYPIIHSILLDRVKPQRDKLKPSKQRLKDNWWIYEHNAPKLRQRLLGVDSVICITVVSKTCIPVLVPASQIFSDSVFVFPISDYDLYSILSSNIHLHWTMKYSSTMKKDIRYVPSVVIECIPMPKTIESAPVINLDKARKEFMKSNKTGLTKTYNRVHNPEENDSGIEKLRQLHATLDVAVRDAYGWQDIELGHGFHDTKQGIRWTISPGAQRQVLDRLLALNHERFENEQNGVIQNG